MPNTTGKLPGETLTAGEFKNRYPAFRKWVRECRGRGNRLDWPVDFVRELHREERRRQRDEERERSDDDSWQRADESETRTRPVRREWGRWIPSLPPPAATPRVGRKSKKCCGR